jgi:hypothetical protein
LPPYADLNPTELIRASVKEYVGRNNVSFCLDDAVKLAEGKVRYHPKGRMEFDV